MIPGVSINFIASGVKGEGSCAQVKEIVNRLHSSGSRTVYGIVDWDLTNSGNERVKVLGRDNRYSIENYILDPVLVAAFLVREKHIERDTIGLDGHETYVSFATFDSAKLQEIANFVVNKVKLHVPSATEGDDLPCQYFGGQSINLPKWFLHTQGHKLEDLLKDVFPPLKSFRDEDKLKLAIIERVIDDCPALIPQDFLSLFKEIQNIS